ncbi:MAG: LPS assembly lipoprotein LptE [Pseudolabrys sp.]
MWWLRPLARLIAVAGLAALTAGCFQPMYAERTAGGPRGVGLADKLSTVEVASVSAPNGTRLSRVGTELRDSLIFNLTGGSGPGPSSYRLNVTLSSSQTQVIVDITSGRPDIQNYGIDATYDLVDLSTGKSIMSGRTFSRVSYNIPGQQQRFAGDRGLRDAEDRAAKVIAENIRNRLASFFVAGT